MVRQNPLDLYLYRDPAFPPKIIYNTYQNADCHPLLQNKQAMAAFESPEFDGVIWWAGRDRSGNLDYPVEIDVLDKAGCQFDMIGFTDDELSEITDGYPQEEDEARVVYRAIKMVNTARKAREATKNG